jgi:undecaprenyl diphosphate synthase
VVPPQTRRPGTPRHVAVIMDGNGRWASRRALPRHVGHRAGVRAVRATVEGCAKRGVEALTLFAFSSENWGRPNEEVARLMELFIEAMDRELDDLDRNGIRLRFIGDRGTLKPHLVERIAAAEARTAPNANMTLYVALSYGGRWDIAQAARRVAERVAAGELRPDEVDEAIISRGLELADAPEPDLFIRTGGEQRLSNFLLWHLAYTELYFCDTLWPDFGDGDLERAFRFFGSRQRRFGLTTDQVAGA